MLKLERTLESEVWRSAVHVMEFNKLDMFFNLFKDLT